MEKLCTHLMFIFEVVAYECHVQSTLWISTNVSIYRFLTVQLSLIPFDDTPGDGDDRMEPKVKTQIPRPSSKTQKNPWTKI